MDFPLNFRSKHPKNLIIFDFFFFPITTYVACNFRWAWGVLSPKNTGLQCISIIHSGKSYSVLVPALLGLLEYFRIRSNTSGFVWVLPIPSRYFWVCLGSSRSVQVPTSDISRSVLAIIHYFHFHQKVHILTLIQKEKETFF